jgi:hypothetical protein
MFSNQIEQNIKMALHHCHGRFTSGQLAGLTIKKEANQYNPPYQ